MPELALLLAVWRGHRWASGVLGGSFLLVALAAIFVIVTDRWAWTADLLIGGWGAVLGAWALVLFRSPALRAYQEHQRT